VFHVTTKNTNEMLGAGVGVGGGGWALVIKIRKYVSKNIRCNILVVE
jgi:hypothetical protein